VWGGKIYAAMVLAEALLKASLQVVVMGLVGV
jgi:hypothetical protein